MNMTLAELTTTILILITCATSLIGFSNQAFFQRYQFHIGAIRHHKQYYRLITSAFLHADVTHLFFNMFTLYFFAQSIIVRLGLEGFLILYFGAILAGNLFSLWLYKNRPSYAAIGASGGVSGVLFAVVALAPLKQILFFFIPMTAWIFATLYFAYSVAMMLNPRQWDNTGHAAHLGGAVCGMALVGLTTPIAFMVNWVYISIMSLPLLYLAYEILINKKAR